MILRNRSFNPRVFILFLCLAVPVFWSCIPPTVELHEMQNSLNSSLSRKDYSAVTRTIESSSHYTARNNELLLKLDTGIANLFQSNHDRAIPSLIRVGELSEEYYTKSISSQALSLLANDTVLPYTGEEYEISLAGSLAAIAFAQKDKFEDALVEVRKTEHRLSVMSSSYEGENKYSDDAFAHYLAGVLYEAAGNCNDAVISYKKAWQLYGGKFYPMKPKHLGDAIVRNSLAAGIDPEISLADSTVTPAPFGNSLILTAFTGRGPYKEEVSLIVPFTKDEITYSMKIAIPVLKTRQSSIASVRFAVDDNLLGNLECVCDYNHIGKIVFEDKKPAILAKTAARVSIRYIAQKESKEKLLKKCKEDYEKKKKEDENSFNTRMAKVKLDFYASALDGLANELLEHADTRCSSLCSAQVFLAHVPISEGSHRLSLEYLDSSGSVIETEKREITVVPNQRAIQVFNAPY